MTSVIPIVCVLASIAAIIPVIKRDDKLSSLSVQSANILGWLGVLGGAAGIYTGELSGAAPLMGIAGCSMLAVLPAYLPSVSTRRFTGPAVGCVAAALGVGALIGAPSVGAQMSIAGQAELLLLYAALFGTVTAALSSLIASTSLADLALGPDARRTPSVGAALLIVGLTSAVWLLGAARSTQGLGSWAVPLAVSGESLVWTIPDGASLPRGLTLEATHHVGWVVPLLAVSVAGAAAASWASLAEKSKTIVAGFWAVPGLAAGALAFVLSPGRLTVAAPEAERYVEIATRWLVERGLSEELAERGAFAVDGDAALDAAALLPEYVLLGCIGLLSLSFVMLSLIPPPSAPEDESDAIAVSMLSRDMTVRAVIVGWLAWLMTVLIHWAHFGYYGVGSPSEVVFLGALVLASSIALLGWSLPRTPPWGRLRPLVSGLMFTALVLAIAGALVFNTPVGLSLSF